MPNKIITAHFTLNGVPVTGLTPVIDIVEMDPIVPTTNTVVVGGDNLTEVGGGWYRYDFATYDYKSNYVFTIDGGAALPDSQRYKVGANESYEEETSSGVWEEQAVDHTNTGTTGMTLNAIKADTASILISETNMVVLLETLLKYERNRTRINLPTNQLIIYDDDGVTPLTTFNLKDFNGSPSVQEVCERVPV